MTRVLVVDDDRDSQEVLTDILSFNGIDVQTVGSGEAAIEQVSRMAYEAIIVDLRLPGMDGWELLRELQSETDSPCIAITVYDSKEVEDEAYRAGFAGYFVKPVNELTFSEDVLNLIL